MKFCAFDIETTGRIPQWKSGAIWSDETTLYTESYAEYIEALRFHARKRYVFVAHNAEYDAGITMWNAGEDLAIHYVNDSYDVGLWNFGNKRRRAQVWDTVKLTAGMSLAELGEAMGLPKYSTPRALLGEDDWRPSWVCDEHGKRECLECYNLRDAEIVWSFCNVMREFLESHGCNLHRSVPGTAVELWRKWDLDTSQTLRSPKFRALGRQAFHSGRCEVFKYGAVPYVNTYDRRSHYGYLLATMELPDSKTLRHGDSSTRWATIANCLGVVDASVWVEPQHVPPLPARFNDRTYFPVGTFRGQWPIAELQTATEWGAEVLQVHSAAWTDKGVRPFAVTAPALLDLREEALRRNDPRQLIYKLWLNSLIGRLGMREAQSRRIYKRWKRGMSAESKRGWEMESSNDAVYLVKEIVNTEPSRYSNVIWAACMTGYGRSKLYLDLQAAGQSVCYCDTDSVHSLSTLPTMGNAPGDLVDTGFYDKALYIGPKLYRLESQTGEVSVRAKGISRKYAEKFLTDGKVTYETTLSIPEAVRRGSAAGVWVDVTRSLSYGIGARTIHDASILRDRTGYSPTSPVVMTMQDDGDTTLTHDIIAT